MRDVILLIDNDQIVRKFFRDLFNESYEVVDVDNFSEGIEKSSQYKDRIFVVICEPYIAMTSGGSLEKTPAELEFTRVIQQIKKNLNGIKVIELTAQQYVEGINMRKTTMGIDEHISKPLSLEIITNMIETEHRRVNGDQKVA